MSRDKPLLYSYFRSSCSWRVRIALALKSVDYEYAAVHLVKGDQRKREYLETVNPLGQVPALVTEDGFTLTQSLAIIEYLEERYHGHGTALLPSDRALRAKAREIAEVINAGTQAPQNLAVMNRARETDEGRREWSHFFIEKGLRAVEAIVRRSKGKYCVGDEVTVADCCLVPQVANAERFNVDMSQFPSINEILENLKEVEGFAAAHPKVQPDFPKED